jgi:nitrogen fixation protein FixH
MKSLWRFFPLAVVAGLGLVVVVNAGLVYAALHSFPGKAGDEDFALSNRYDAVLAQAEREAALGWSVAARADADGRIVVLLTDRTGAPLRGAAVTASAERPLGERELRSLVFHETAAGQFVADSVLSAPGQWELTLSASAAGHDIAATRRVIVR